MGSELDRFYGRPTLTGERSGADRDQRRRGEEEQDKDITLCIFHVSLEKVGTGMA